VTGVIAQGNRLALGRAQPALGAEDQELRPPRLGRIPAHARILDQAEDVAAGAVPEQVLGQRQAPGRAGGMGLDLENLRCRGIEKLVGGTHYAIEAVRGGETRKSPFHSDSDANWNQTHFGDGILDEKCQCSQSSQCSQWRNWRNWLLAEKHFTFLVAFLALYLNPCS